MISSFAFLIGIIMLAHSYVIVFRLMKISDRASRIELSKRGYRSASIGVLLILMATSMQGLDITLMLITFFPGYILAMIALYLWGKRPLSESDPGSPP